MKGPAYFEPDRVKWSMLFRRGVLVRYLRLIFTGSRPDRGVAGEDMLQLGGDFILSSDQRLVYAHRSNDLADRPSASNLVQQGQQLAGPSGNRASPVAGVAK
jgi:hypothetical protein